MKRPGDADRAQGRPARGGSRPLRDSLVRTPAYNARGNPPLAAHGPLRVLQGNLYKLSSNLLCRLLNFTCDIPQKFVPI